jgi:hypothetical protein
MLLCFYLDGLRKDFTMRRKLLIAVLCLFLHTGCYVRTKMQTENRQLPTDFSAPVLVVTVQDKMGFDQAHLSRLERDVHQALTAEGIQAVTLTEAIGRVSAGDLGDRLRNNDYRALLKIVITFWGSKTETLHQPVPPSVDSIQTDRDSSLYQPGSIERSEQPGPTTSYKQVAMNGSLLDLQGERIIWSARLRAGPGLVGRSFLYHSFNRSLQYEDLAKDCFRKLSRKLAAILPKN